MKNMQDILNNIRKKDIHLIKEIESSKEYRETTKYGLILLGLVFIIILVFLHKTTIFEQLVFNYLAIVEKYDIQLDNKYTILTKDGIYVIYRYDENESIEDEYAKANDLYSVDYKVDLIQSSQNILANIDNTLDTVKNEKLGINIFEEINVKTNKEIDITGYEIDDISKIDGQTQIKYYNNIPIILSIKVTKLFIENEPIDTSTMTFYKGESLTIEERLQQELDKKQGKTIEKTNDTKKEIDYDNFETYTNIICLDGTHGIIAVSCINNDDYKKEAEKIINKLLKITHIERTKVI